MICAVPVVKPLALEPRYSASWAISSAVPMRPMGWRAAKAAYTSSTLRPSRSAFALGLFANTLAQGRGVDGAGADGVAADVLAHKVRGDRAGQANHCAFAGAVGEAVRHAFNGGCHRGHVDD